MEATPMQEYGFTRTHASFAALTLDERRALVEPAVSRFTFRARLVEVATDAAERSYVLLALLNEDGSVKAYATLLVCHSTYKEVRYVSRAVYLESGHYGIETLREGALDLEHRVGHEQF